MSSASRHSMLRALGMVVLGMILINAAGCAAIRERRGKPKESGFLRDYSQLGPKEGYQAQLVYINPDAQWSRYDSIHIDSVTLWVNRDAPQKLSAEQRQLLTDILYKALDKQLGMAFKIVDRPGPDVLRFRAALTQAKGANVPLNTITAIVPQLRLASMAVGWTADTAMTVGSATVEVEVLDSITNQRLAAAVDQRAGTRSLGTLFEKWGDVEKACEFWAERAKVVLLQLGVRRKR